MKTVVIIGGGASGLMAALTAAQDRNNRVLLLERQQRLGRKLLATGNGRCNLTNTGASLANYHGSDPAFPGYALSRFTPSDTLAFFPDLSAFGLRQQRAGCAALCRRARGGGDTHRLLRPEREAPRPGLFDRMRRRAL